LPVSFQVRIIYRIVS